MELVWIIGPILVVLGFYSVGSFAILAAKMPGRPSPPSPVDLASVPGVNSEFLERNSTGLKELGFRHVLDFELPHFNVHGLRTVTASFSSPDGLILASINQKFSNQFAHDFITFTTFFKSGDRLLTTSNPMPVPDVTPILHHQRFPDSTDLKMMLERQRAALDAGRSRWGGPETVSSPADIDRLYTEGYAKEVEILTAAGMFKLQGESIEATPYGAGVFFWRGIKPIPANYSAKDLLVRIGIPSLLAVALGLAAPIAGAHLADVVQWGMGVVGLLYGVLLWYHGYFWCLLIPALATGLGTHDPHLAAKASVSAAIGLVAGFLFSAGRSQTRGPQGPRVGRRGQAGMSDDRPCEFCGTSMPSDQLVTITGKSVCARCKPEVVLNLKSGIGSGPRISAERAGEIRRRIAGLNRMSFAFAVPGILMQVAIPALAMSGLRPGLSLGVFGVLRLLSVVLIVAGLGSYARMKGRSSAWGLLGVLSCIGLLILALLGKECRNCREKAPSREKECRACGAAALKPQRFVDLPVDRTSATVRSRFLLCAAWAWSIALIRRAADVRAAPVRPSR